MPSPPVRLHPFAPPTVRPALSLLPVAVALLALTACSSGEQPATSDTAAVAAAVTPAVEIDSPLDGDTVSLPFTITLKATGVEVVPANGQREPGKGHHHLLVDVDVEADTLPLPPTVIHMGNGATQRVIDSLPPGPHRIMAVFATGDHVPDLTVKRDTITVIVRGN